MIAPDIALERDTDDIGDPHERNEEKNDCDNKRDCVFCVECADDTVDCPNDVKRGDSEDDLHDERKTVESIDKFFHGDFSFGFIFGLKPLYIIIK